MGETLKGGKVRRRKWEFCAGRDKRKKGRRIFSLESRVNLSMENEKGLCVCVRMYVRVSVCVCFLSCNWVYMRVRVVCAIRTAERIPSEERWIVKCRRTGRGDGTVGRERVGLEELYRYHYGREREVRPEITKRYFNRSFKSRKLSTKWNLRLFEEYDSIVHFPSPTSLLKVYYSQSWIIRKLSMKLGCVKSDEIHLCKIHWKEYKIFALFQISRERIFSLNPASRCIL